MTTFKAWFQYEDEEVELSDLEYETTISAIRKIIHEGKIFHFPYGTSQTDIQIGVFAPTGTTDKFEKYKARSTLGDIQYKVGDTLQVRVKKNKVTSDNASIPTLNVSILDNSERVVKWDYNPFTTTGQWTCTAILVKMESVPFAEGSFRKAYYLHDLSKEESSRHVAKIGKKPTPRANYFEDVKMQAIARRWSQRYNDRKPPKKIDFLPSCVLEFVDRGSHDNICGVEPYVEGQYRKYNNNSGFVSNDDRNTPQAFSHFSYEHSNNQLLIIDIQGVGDHYTDPQIHTYDGVGYGIGNLGKKGFEKFIDTHKCNAICQYLNLSMINPKSEKSDCGTVPRPDLFLPDTSERDQVNNQNNNNNNNNNNTTTTSISVSVQPHQDISPPSTTTSTSIKVQPSSQPPPQQQQPQNDSREKEKAIERKNREDRKKDQLNWDINGVKIVDTVKGYHNTISLCICENYLFTGYSDNTIRVFEFKNDNNNLELFQTLKGHEGPVEAMCFNDQYIFSGSGDHSIKVWDKKKLRCIFTLEGHDKPIHCLAINDKFLFSGSSDKTIKVWDLKTLECKVTLEGHQRAVKSITLSGHYLFSGSSDKTIKIWDFKEPKTIRCNYTLKGHSKWVTAVCIVGSTLYSGSYDKTIRLWSLKSLECIATLRGHEGWVENMTATDKYLFSASDDNSIKVWDLETQRCISTLEGHNASVQSLALLDNCRRLVSTSHDQTIKLWSWDLKEN